jgi:hypothetical protein
MSTRSKALAAILIGLEALASLGMLAVSVHGPDGLAVAAPVYLLAAAGLTWWIARRFDSALVLLGVGILLLAAVPGVVLALDQAGRMAHERRVAATRVDGVRDEPILSASGRPIGVRVSYTVSVPKRGFFAILPSLHTREQGVTNLRLDALRWTIDGRSEPVALEPGRRHAMAVEMYPPILAYSRGERCLVSLLVPALLDDVSAAPLRIVIYETTYGNTARGGREEVTRGAYDLAELYRGVLAEELKPCAS